MSQVDALNYRFKKALLKTQPRERWILLITWFVVWLGLFQGLLWITGLSNSTPYQRDIQQYQRQTEANQSAIQQILDRQNSAEIQQLRRKEEQLSEQIRQIDDGIQKSSNYLIEPEQMPELLQQLLAGYKGLKLVSISTKPTEAIESDIVNTQLYRHGLVVRIKGSFKTMADWLKSIEELPWVINWDRLKYQTEKWPTGDITIEIHTLSTKEAFLGV